MRRVFALVLLTLASAPLLSLTACGGCYYEAVADDFEIDADGDEPESCLEVRMGPVVETCGPTDSLRVVIDNRCDAPLVFDDADTPEIPAGALGTQVSSDAAEQSMDDDRYVLTGSVDGVPVAISWSLQ